jgi:hypothetical protein
MYLLPETGSTLPRRLAISTASSIALQAAGPWSFPAPVPDTVLFKIFNMVCEIVDLGKDLLVHPVLPFHYGADKITGYYLELHVRDPGILLKKIKPGPAPSCALWYPRPGNLLPSQVCHLLKWTPGGFCAFSRMDLF